MDVLDTHGHTHLTLGFNQPLKWATHGNQPIESINEFGGSTAAAPWAFDGLGHWVTGNSPTKHGNLTIVVCP